MSKTEFETEPPTENFIEINITEAPMLTEHVAMDTSRYNFLTDNPTTNRSAIMNSDQPHIFISPASFLDVSFANPTPSKVKHGAATGIMDSRGDDWVEEPQSTLQNFPQSLTRVEPEIVEAIPVHPSDEHEEKDDKGNENKKKEEKKDEIQAQVDNFEANMVRCSKMEFFQDILFGLILGGFAVILLVTAERRGEELYEIMMYVTCSYFAYFVCSLINKFFKLKLSRDFRKRAYLLIEKALILYFCVCFTLETKGIRIYATIPAGLGVLYCVVLKILNMKRVIKNPLLLRALIWLTILLVSLKVDEFIDASWALILIPFYGFIIFIFGCGLGLVAEMNDPHKKKEPTSQVVKLGFYLWVIRAAFTIPWGWTLIAYLTNTTFDAANIYPPLIISIIYSIVFLWYHYKYSSLLIIWHRLEINSQTIEMKSEPANSTPKKEKLTLRTLLSYRPGLNTKNSIIGRNYSAVDNNHPLKFYVVRISPHLFDVYNDKNITKKDIKNRQLADLQDSGKELNRKIRSFKNEKVARSDTVAAVAAGLHRSRSEVKKKSLKYSFTAHESTTKEDEEARMEELKIKCSICHTQYACTVLQPCGHYYLCKTCALELNKCYVCNKEIDHFHVIDKEINLNNDIVRILQTITEAGKQMLTSDKRENSVEEGGKKVRSNEYPRRLEMVSMADIKQEQFSMQENQGKIELASNDIYD